MFANHGSLEKHNHIIEGINSRMDGLQASILCAKLPYILNWTEMRIKNAFLYNKYLSSIKEIELPRVKENTKHTFHLYVIKAERRDELKSYLQENGVQSVINYPVPLPFMPAYAYLNIDRVEYSQVEINQSKILSLPIFPEIKEEQIEYIAKIIKNFYASK